MIFKIEYDRIQVITRRMDATNPETPSIMFRVDAYVTWLDNSSSQHIVDIMIEHDVDIIDTAKNIIAEMYGPCARVHIKAISVVSNVSNGGNGGNGVNTVSTDILCEGCAIDAPGQLAHMGDNGCLRLG